MVLTYEQILSNLKQGEYAPVYLLQGEEPYFIDQISNYIEQHALSDADKGFNQMVLYGKEVNMGQLINAVRQYPLMADRRVVVLREAQEMSELTKEDKNQLLEKYVEQPLSSTIFVVCYKYKKLDGRKSLYKKFEKHAIVLNSDKVRDYQLPAWIEKYLRHEQFKFSDNVPQLLADYLGNDLSRIHNEIEKLKISLGDKKIIDDKVIQNNIGISKEFNVFELQRALLHKDEAKCYQIIKYFSANPKVMPPMVLITVLFNYFLNVLRVHALPDKTEAAAAKELGINPFVVKEYLQAARMFDVERIFRIFGYLLDADLKFKGVEVAQVSDESIYLELMFNILKR